MKKLNKLLMPVVGLSTIAATAIPLAACSKKYTDGVEVTSDEWNNALEYLSGLVDGATWKSTGDDAFVTMTYDDQGELSETATMKDIAFNDDLGIMTSVRKLPGAAAINGQIASIAKSNMYFTYSKDEGEHDWMCMIDEYSAFVTPLVVIIGAIGGQDEFTFDSKTKSYTYDKDWEYESQTAHSKIAIKFDSNKKITAMGYETSIGDTEAAHTVIDLVLHPQYSNVTVDVPAELISRANGNVYEMVSKKAEFTPTEATKKDGKIILNVTSNGSYDTLNFAHNAGVTYHPSCIYIFLDGKMLTLNEDYTTSEATDKTTTITFKNTVTIKEGSKLNIAFSVPGNAPKLTATLSKA